MKSIMLPIYHKNYSIYIEIKKQFSPLTSNIKRLKIIMCNSVIDSLITF